ncbi:ADP-ribosylglycohydrolase family protein [Longispora albida]|uniref:ADP-ribosylglycohydrolase family protein n=1 Tax=Longispora albida TaxID=203523 RepID=UPI00036A24D9|nr:ADP-ribosylglycohydrolase family protein [Longispora albida]
MTVAGSLYGLAYGDALGAPAEFKNMAEIAAMYGPGGPRELAEPVARVTDDTQMAIAFAEALISAPSVTPAGLEPAIRAAYVAWWASEDNNRAPGMTCLTACEALDAGLPWAEAAVAGSKGCGANMRATPAGLMPGLTAGQRSGAAQLQAAMTHGHPTGLAASELTAFAVRYLLDGVTPAALPGALREHAESQRRVYHGDWLGDLWQRPGSSTPEDYIARGWDECLHALDVLDTALRYPDRDADPCLATGAGWIAEEALATGLYCFLLYPDEPVAALSRAAASSGDSDSIACLAGAFAGAVHGMDGWPAHWREVIEYEPALGRIAAAFA